MVEDHIEYDCDASFMTFVDELFVHSFRPIGSVWCEVVVGRVSPVVVAVEFADRHEFDSVDAELLEVVESEDESWYGSFGGVVIDPEFVDDEVIFVGSLEVKSFVGPLELWFIGLQDRYISVALLWVVDEFGVNGFGFVFIVGV